MFRFLFVQVSTISLFKIDGQFRFIPQGVLHHHIQLILAMAVNFLGFPTPPTTWCKVVIRLPPTEFQVQ